MSYAYDPAVPGVPQQIECLDAEVHESHREAPHYKAMRDNYNIVRGVFFKLQVFPFDLSEHAMDEMRTPVISISRRFSVLEAVVEPPMDATHSFLRHDAFIAMINLPQSGIFIDLGRAFVNPRAKKHVFQRLSCSFIGGAVNQRLAQKISTEFLASIKPLLAPLTCQLYSVISNRTMDDFARVRFALPMTNKIDDHCFSLYVPRSTRLKASVFLRIICPTTFWKAPEFDL